MERLKVTVAGLESGYMWVAHCDCLSCCTIELRTDSAVKSLMLTVYLYVKCTSMECIETVVLSFNNSYLFSNVLLPVMTRSSDDTDKTVRRV